MNFKNLNRSLYKNTAYAVLFFIVLSFILDFLDKGFDIRANRVLKAVYFGYAISFLILQFNYVRRNTFYVVILLPVITLLFLFKHDFWHLYTEDYIRYLFFILSLPLIHHAIFTMDKKIVAWFQKVFKVFIIVNLFSISIGIIFKINMFETYVGYRLGYNGIILSQGMTAYIYMATLVFFWMKRDNLMIAITILLILLTGVKGAYLAAFLFLVFAVFLHKKLSKHIKIKILSVVIVVFLILLIVFFNTPTFSKIINARGWLAAIFSYRLDTFNDIMATKSAIDFNWITGAHGICPFKTEMQAIDILLFYGVIGVCAFIYLMCQLYNKHVSTVISKSYFFSILITSLFIGNLFYNPIASTVFVVILFILDSNNRNESPT